MQGERDEDTDVFFWTATVHDRSIRSSSSRVQVDVWALSAAGKVRPNNEDHFLVARFDRMMQTLLTNLPPGQIPEQCGETNYSMLVSDGMGGEAAGEVASRNAIGILVDLVLQTPDWILRLDEHWLREVQRRMEQRFRKKQETLTEQAQDGPALSGMGTTITAADACRVPVGQALDAGGRDNVTVVLSRYRIPEEGG
jgi:PPM family protein phosphatase